MKRILSGCLVFLLVGCSREVAPSSNQVSLPQLDENRAAKVVPSSTQVSLSQFDETRAASVAQQALTDWIAENPQEAGQIQGAVLDSVEVKGDLLHVVLVHDNSQYDSEGDGALHIAHFNVYLDLDYQVDRVERGPDIIE